MKKQFIEDMCSLKDYLERIYNFKNQKETLYTYIDFFNCVTKSKRIIYNNPKYLNKCLTQKDLSNILGVLSNLLTLANYVKKIETPKKENFLFVYENINYFELNYIITLIDDIIKRPFRFEFRPITRKHQDLHKYLRLHNENII